jgi:hypothetical protein
MKFIIDGDYNKELISLIVREKLPVTHIIAHVPQNPLGNSSIFLPKLLPTFKEFENYTNLIGEHGITPIAGIDSTCQGNLEAHAQQYKAINTFFEKLQELDYKDILVSSPNNVGYINANFPSMKIYLSYSQYVTSLNRCKIFFNLGTDFIILHPDIIRYFHVLKNFIKLKQNTDNSRKIDYILPLNLGCNWGCIHWYQHHNMQSHRTINSPLISDQQTISDVENEYDYPLLYCWKKRLEEPLNILKTGWISPDNIELYEKLGYDTFLLFTSGFSNEKILEIIKSYRNKSLINNFNQYLNFPQPYGNYWPSMEIRNSMNHLNPEIIKDFCHSFPYEEYYPFENGIDDHCNKYLQQLKNGNIRERDKIIEFITKKMQEMEKGAIGE